MVPRVTGKREDRKTGGGGTAGQVGKWESERVGEIARLEKAANCAPGPFGEFPSQGDSIAPGTPTSPQPSPPATRGRRGRRCRPSVYTPVPCASSGQVQGEVIGRLAAVHLRYPKPSRLF